MKHLPKEIWSDIIKALLPRDRLRLFQTSKGAKGHIVPTDQRQLDRIWTYIFSNDRWAQGIISRRLNLVLLGQNMKNVFDDPAERPYLALAIIGPLVGLHPRDIFPGEFLKSLRFSEISVETLEIEFPDFTLNVSGVIQLGAGITLPKIDSLIKHKKSQAILYNNTPGIYTVETKEISKGSVQTVETTRMESILIRTITQGTRERRSKDRGLLRLKTSKG
ncbi:hypothetical protein BGZ63DRAFT_379413 [Mariannaea sp. PMI_226]|nr:hypothetical protein BGZ63DRAFT_379413 [Mariannaea sp. PMI_226]